MILKRGSDKWRRSYWGEPCVPGNKVTYVWHGMDAEVKSAGVLASLVPAFRALNDVFVAHGYQVVSAGSYNCRRITGGTVYSAHAWSLALDINPATNPYTKTCLVTDIPKALIRDVYRIRTGDGHRVWRWGGDWDGYWNIEKYTVWDAMHFEIIVTPAEIATGVYYNDKEDYELIEILRGMPREWWFALNEKTGIPAGDVAYWADGRASDAEWEDAAPVIWRAALGLVVVADKPGPPGPPGPPGADGTLIVRGVKQL